MAFFKQKPPWEINVNPHASREEMQKKGDASEEIKKGEMARGGKWARWEKGRREALKERRDYFRKNQNKKDDFSGV